MVSGLASIGASKTQGETPSLGFFLSSESDRIFCCAFGMVTWAYCFRACPISDS